MKPPSLFQIRNKTRREERNDEHEAGEEEPENHQEPEGGTPTGIDDEKWEQMLSTTTIPFELPAPGVKITIKVIDQTGMEHMTVIDDPRREK